MDKQDYSRKGYVYILSNKAMPGVVKIGRSIHGGGQRAKQMYSTGVPCPFDLEFEVMSDDAVSLEADIHYELSDCRVGSDREFFSVDMDRAINALSDCWLRRRGFSMVKAECEIDEAVLYWLSSEALRMGYEIGPDEVYGLVMDSVSASDVIDLHREQIRRSAARRAKEQLSRRYPTSGPERAS